MDPDRRNNLMLVLVATLFVGTLNLLIWTVAREGVIPPINDTLLWGAFALLSVIVIPWAISQLGLQPLVISLSYVAGGFVAFRGMEGSAGIHLAEVTTAGAAYGAFGAVAMGNVTDKIRLPFFDRRQTGLMFTMLCLLLLMALLNSEIIGATNSAGYLKAVFLPFALSGIVISSGWSIYVGMKTGRKPRPASKSKVLRKTAEEKTPVENEEQADTGVLFQMPVETDEEVEANEGSFVPRLSLPDEVQFEKDEPYDSRNEPVRPSAEQDPVM